MTQKRRLIDPNDPDLPDNIFAIEGDSWERALWEIEKNLKQAPYNVGHFSDPSFQPGADLDALLKRMVQQETIEDWDYGFTNKEDVDKLLTYAFNSMAYDAALGREDRATLDRLKDYLAGRIKPLLDIWPDETQVTLQFRGRERTLAKLSSHIDLGRAGKSENWRSEAFNDVSFYVLMPFNSVGTTFHDHRDVVSEGKVKEVKPGGLKSYFGPKAQSDPAQMFHAKPWSTSILASHIWTHMPPMHSQPVTFDEQPEKRCLAFMVVNRL